MPPTAASESGKRFHWYCKPIRIEAADSAYRQIREGVEGFVRKVRCFLRQDSNLASATRTPLRAANS